MRFEFFASNSKLFVGLLFAVLYLFIKFANVRVRNVCYRFALCTAGSYIFCFYLSIPYTCFVLLDFSVLTLVN